MREPTSTLSAHHVTVQRLQAIAGQLAGIDQLTEEAFLRIGRQAGEGHRRAMALTGLAEEALQPGERESAEQTVARLQLLTERSALWLSEALGRSAMICGTLNVLGREVETLHQPLRELANVVKTLQALRVATRIEAARSHGHGALVLGQELQSLGVLMQEKLELITARCEVLATLRQRALAIEARAQAGPLREADGEIRQSRLLLGRVAAQCIRTSDQTARMQENSRTLTENFGELIAALQFQDITRQRLQHVRRALEGLLSALLEEAGRAPAVGSICQLQHEQLAWAVAEFCEATGRLDRNLRKMAAGVQLLADDARAALMAGSSEQCARIAPSLQAVTECLEKVQTTHLAAGQAVFAVCQAVGDVAALAGEIETLGEEMQLLAQNAAVSAAHGSVQAAGLTVIAGNIQLLAEDAGRYAAAMAAGCQRVNALADELDAGEQQSDSRESDLGVLLDEARTLLGRLEAINRSFDVRLAAISGEVAGLDEEIRSTLEGFDIQRRFLLQVTPVLEELQEMAREQGSAVQDAADDRMLVNLQSRYTMMSERDVHQRFLHGDAAPPDAAAPVGSVISDLGSNVELF